jgi:enediyne biosynthesis protein E4
MARSRNRLLVVWCAVAGVVLGCTSAPQPTSSGPQPEPEPTGPAWFEDVTDRLGINFTQDPGQLGSYAMPQIVGSGCAACDLDGDGRPDLLFLTNGGAQSKSANKLYRQKPDGTFEDVSAGSGLDFPGRNMGVAIGDINNDGKPDVVITQFVGTRLFLNQGGMKFKDVTTEVGIRNPLWGASACFVDYDRDGWLDLVIANYLDYEPSWDCTSPGGGKDFCAPKTFAGTCSKLFRNRGPQPGGGAQFEDVSLAAGLGRLPGPGLGVVCADFDGDGWPDIFIANDGKPNHLWINQKNGTFTEEALSRGVAVTQMGAAYAGMGIALGDADNDGLLDLYVTHLTSETNTFWKQEPRGQFRDQTTAWCSAAKWRGTGFGTLMADFDLDGFSDLAVVNGRVSKGDPHPVAGINPFWEPYAERNQIFANEGGKRFRDVSPQNTPFCGTHNVARGLACADLDRDGAPDLVLTTSGGRARVYRNVCPNRGHWLAVRATDPKLNRDAYGAEITVRAGAALYLRVLNPAVSYLSSNSALTHCGLGAAASFEGIEVLWPDGTREVFPGGPADRLVELQKGSGRKP